MTPHTRPNGRPAAADPVIQVLVVERDRMARLGLMQVLSTIPSVHVAGVVATVSEAEHLPASTPVAVVLMSSDAFSLDGGDAISRLLTRFRFARVAVLGADMSPALITAALRNGADGYLPRDISTKGLERSLLALASGETALPRAVLRVLVDTLRRGLPSISADQVLSVLSARELDVLTEISHGRSNAEIAVFLGLKESTVKTHVSNILRKTGARSRHALMAREATAEAV
jgi:DNA-binding NarL/FixJ family response regulator